MIGRRRMSVLSAAFSTIALGSGTSQEQATRMGVTDTATDRRNGTLPRWLQLPSTPGLPPYELGGAVDVGDTTIHYASYGVGPAVVLLHGGMANSNYWGLQIRELAGAFRVIVVDTRGHGRSRLSGQPFSFSLFARDVIELMDHVGLQSATIAGWSDGAITGLELAMKYPERVQKLFSFGANFNLTGLIPNGSAAAAFRQFTQRCKSEYADLSPEPDCWVFLKDKLRQLWKSEPNYQRTDLERIRCPVMVARGDHDEIIKGVHSERLAEQIRGARLVTLRDTSHFAMLQAPDQFSAVLTDFLRATPL